MEDINIIIIITKKQKKQKKNFLLIETLQMENQNDETCSVCTFESSDTFIPECFNISDDDIDHHDSFDDNVEIVISPINQDPNSNSNKDFKEQMKRKENNEQMMWDDTKFNKQQEGGIFIFCKNRTKNESGSVYVHKVEKVLPSTDRLPSWSKNVGQTDRNVLYISKEFIKYDWDSWIDIGGPKKVQGTAHIKKNKKNIIDNINNSYIF